MEPKTSSVKLEGTVILLGAGASKHLDLPLADEVLPEMLAFANSEGWSHLGGDQQKSELFEFLTAIYPSFKGDKERERSLEYFLSWIDSYQGFFARGVMRKSDRLVQAHKKLLIQLLVDYIWNKMNRSEPYFQESSYLSLLSQLSDKDTILSLNWDLACEWAFHLCKRQKDWSYLFQEGKVPLLKLHGSINWRPQLKGFRAVHQEIFHSVGKDVSYWEDSLIPWHTEQNSLSNILDETPIIVPPSHFKRVESKTLREVWRQAYIQLFSCKKIIIVGSSLREEDRHLYSLFSVMFWNWKGGFGDSSEKVVKIVGCEKTLNKFRENVYPECELLDTRFENVNWSEELQDS